MVIIMKWSYQQGSQVSHVSLTVYFSTRIFFCDAFIDLFLKQPGYLAVMR